MKKPVTLIALLAILSFQSNAQEVENTDACKITELVAGNGRHLKIVGEKSSLFSDALFAQYPKTKKKGYIWKFKNVQVPGIEEPITFKVHQGLNGTYGKETCDPTSCGGGSYFHTFTSEKYKKSLLDNQQANEQYALIIYFRDGRKSSIKTHEEAELIKKYLLSIQS